MVDWKRNWLPIVGALFFILIGGYCSVYWVTSPEEIRISVDKTIQEAAEDNEIGLTKAGYLRNEFVVSVGRGGAGGMGNNVIGFATAIDFLSQAEENNVENIFYRFEEGDPRFSNTNFFTIKYWFLSSGGVFEFRDIYTSGEEFAFVYSAQEYNENTIIFRKTGYQYIMLILCSAFMAVAATAIIYLIAHIRELPDFLRHL